MKVPTKLLSIVTAASSRIAKQNKDIEILFSSKTRLVAADEKKNIEIASTMPKAKIGPDTSRNKKQERKLKIMSSHIMSSYLNSGEKAQQSLGDPRVLSSGSASSSLGDSTCDSSFLTCVLSPSCRSCFSTLQENNVDWTNVVPDTPCQDVLGFLVASGHCQSVRDEGNDATDIFCSTFDSCVIWDDDEEGGLSDDNIEGELFIDCSALKECKWDGMHEHFLGDGVCHDAMPGCYNSKVCNYDGGDCCSDTCVYPGQSSSGSGGNTNNNNNNNNYNVISRNDYGDCGVDGYVCRDPKSHECRPALARMYGENCDNENATDTNFDDDIVGSGEDSLPSCASDQSLYRLVQFDSWGDGWDNAVLTLSERDTLSTSDPIYQGGLEFGSQGTVHLCLTKNEPKCYQVKVENGVWGNEISWALHPLSAGAPAIAAGGSPSDCTISLGGLLDDCETTCELKRPDTEINDPNYQSYKDMEACIEQKCLIQVGSCAQDKSCADCMHETTPDYCFANENFNALIDCSMCSCTEIRPMYCDAKASSSTSAAANGSSASSHEGKIKPATSKSEGKATGSVTGGSVVCSPEQTLKGTQSLVKFSECAKIDQMMAMVTDFDNDNFGMLDIFEECAHNFEKQEPPKGRSALECMKILHKIIIDDDDDDEDEDDEGKKEPNHIDMAISALADHLYHGAESFCECVSDANKEAPLCNSFVHFKTLLYEAVDACKSLDAIDCAAWQEFYTPCKKNLIREFETINFDDPNQCQFVENECGGAGPFPAFRRLDCAAEIPKPAWDFHTLYSRGCLKDGPAPTGPSPSSNKSPLPHPPTPPAPSPTKPSSPVTPSALSPSRTKHYEPYKPKQADEKKPYYSPTSNDEPAATPKAYNSSNDTKKSHHAFRNTFFAFVVLCLAGFGYHKKRTENFNYLRFRQLRQSRNYGAGTTASGEYSGISLEDSCSFEPPTLPPTPSQSSML